MKKDSKLYKESFNLAKNSFEAVLGKYKPDQIKKIKKNSFLRHDLLSGEAASPKIEKHIKDTWNLHYIKFSKIKIFIYLGRFFLVEYLFEERNIKFWK